MNINIFSVIAIGLVSCILAITLIRNHPEISLVLSICAGVVILMMILPQVNGILSLIRSMAKEAGMEEGYLTIVLKSAGVACLTSIASSICKDAGQSSIGMKIELAGRIAILLLGLPVIEHFFRLILLL